jgi:hypothetical protein
MSAAAQPLSAVQGRWSGTMRLWLDPEAPPAEGPSTAEVEGGRLRYTWAFEGAPKEGWIEAAGLRWADTFHQPEPRAMAPMARPGALLAGEMSYPAPEGPDWGWQITLAQRPDGALVLQMTNLCPWGESAPAVMALWTRG